MLIPSPPPLSPSQPLSFSPGAKVRPPGSLGSPSPRLPHLRPLPAPDAGSTGAGRGGGGPTPSLLTLALGAAVNLPDARLPFLLAANALLLLAVNVAGFLVCLATEVIQRKGFRDTRPCIESRLRIQRENQKQERLLLSVLPRHIVMEMKDDMAEGLERETQFHKSYIQKHEHISILFADICGFMILASQYVQRFCTYD